MHRRIFFALALFAAVAAMSAFAGNARASSSHGPVKAYFSCSFAYSDVSPFSVTGADCTGYNDTRHSMKVTFSNDFGAAALSVTIPAYGSASYNVGFTVQSGVPYTFYMGAPGVHLASTIQL